MALIFVSVPSAKATNGGQLTSAFLEELAILHEKYPQHTFICPVVQWYSILGYMECRDTVWETWKPHCLNIIRACDEVWVLLGSGWKIPRYEVNESNSSRGVAGELYLAVQNDKSISFVDVDGLT